MEPTSPPSDSGVPQRRAAQGELPSLLRREVLLLEETLLRVLREDERENLVADVRSLRAATAALREEATDERRKAVLAIVDGLDLDQAEAVARAFTLWFQLVNLAEEHHRIHDLHQRSHVEHPLHESIAEAVDTILREEPSGTLESLIAQLEITPVLTAHPTEARRRAVVEAIERITEQIARLDDPRLSRTEMDEVGRRLLEEVATLWKTDQLRSQRPTPLDEVRVIMALFDETIFRAAPSIYRALDRALDAEQAGIRPPPFPAFLRWGSWVGADRDGNPHVTPDVTRETANIQAEHVLRGLEAVARRVSRALSASDRDCPPSRDLLKVLDEDEQVFPEAAESLRLRMGDQSHRRMLTLMAERIAATRHGAHGAYNGAEELVEDLRLVQRSLEAADAPRLAFGELQHLLWQAETFGFHLAGLEVREHADEHRHAIAELAGDALGDPVVLNQLATQGWPAATQALASTADGLGALSGTTQRVLETLRAMADIQARWGVDACRRYVVSFTRSAADVTAVRALARLAVPEGLVLDVVPLFESNAELARAPELLDELFALQGAAAWLDARDRRLEVMLGYSDSAKEVGMLAANLVLYRAQADLAAWASSNDVRLTIFHGRGGALGRGGGPTNRAIWGQAPGSVAARFKVTEQGEVTFARYGNRQIAHRHLAQVTNAVLRASTPSHERDDRAPKDALVEQMRATSMVAWRSLIEEPGFVDFFLAATPIDEIGDLPLGSRPARRTEGNTDVESLRAIPWVFAWAQARVNLPGWYGLGTGLAAVLEQPEGLEELQRLYREWPFFTSLLQNAELSLVKADLTIGQLHLSLGERPDLVARIEEEYVRSVAHVLAVTGHAILLEEEPGLARDIELRNPYIDALSFLQVRFLREMGEGVDDPANRAAIRRVIQLTVNGVAAGVQNTG